MTVNWTPVSSSNLRAVAYDPTNKALFIEFHGGSVYEYSGVPSIVYDNLMAASSHGQYHAYNIKNVFPYRRIS
jgi:hypothetical protein